MCAIKNLKKPSMQPGQDPIAVSKPICTNTASGKGIQIPDPFYLLQVLVERLRQKCLEENMEKGKDTVKPYSVLNQAPREWELDPHKPCGGERCAQAPEY